MTEPIDYFRTAHPLRRWASRRALKARTAMFRRFISIIECNPETTVVDVGVTPDQELIDSNFFEALYPFPHRITATSIEDASHLEQLYPGLTFVQTNGDALPFPDKAFDVAFSSAVLEHVGDKRRQQQFVTELRRVSRLFFLTTPNRWFPIEVHTMIPLIHWLPQRIHQRILKLMGLDFWSRTENLNLLSARSLEALFEPEDRSRIGRHRILGLTSNLLAWGPTDASEGPARASS